MKTQNYTADAPLGFADDVPEGRPAAGARAEVRLLEIGVELEHKRVTRLEGTLLNSRC